MSMASEPAGRLRPVSTTAIGVAMVRAAELDRADPLFVDPLAADFVTAAAWTPPEPTPERRAGLESLVAWIRIRTKFLDDVVVDACTRNCRQVVILAAGLDARAFRLGLAPDITVFELDLPEIVAFKRDVVAAKDHRASCTRVAVSSDLTGPWPDDLAAAGFEPALPTVWLAEGLLVYLTRAQNEELVDDVSRLAAPGSRLGLTLSGRSGDGERTGSDTPVFEHERLWQSASPGDAIEWLGPRGWSVEVRRPADLAMAYGLPAGTGRGARGRARLIDATRLSSGSLGGSLHFGHGGPAVGVDLRVHDLGHPRVGVSHLAHGRLEVVRGDVGVPGRAVLEHLHQHVEVRVVDAAEPVEADVAGLGPGRLGERGRKVRPLVRMLSADGVADDAHDHGAVLLVTAGSRNEGT
jgi:methyltransferase (TIGR00027 family)